MLLGTETELISRMATALKQMNGSGTDTEEHIGAQETRGRQGSRTSTEKMLEHKENELMKTPERHKR